MTQPQSPRPRAPEEPGELIYLPAPSASPIFAALGLTGLVVGAYAGWFYALVGAIVLVASLVRMHRLADAEIGRLPREQRVISAVLPPEVLARRDGTPR